MFEREQILSRVRATSAWLRDRLRSVKGVEEVRGRGLLLGLRLGSPAADVQKKMLERGVITGTSDDPSVLRLLPPLVLKPEELEPFLDALPHCLE